MSGDEVSNVPVRERVLRAIAWKRFFRNNIASHEDPTTHQMQVRFDRYVEEYRVVLTDDADAAIRAMRAPTVAMIGAGKNALLYEGGMEVRHAWHNMIDAALAEDAAAVYDPVAVKSPHHPEG